MVSLDSFDIATIVGTSLAALAAIILVWINISSLWGKVGVEALLEIGLGLLLTINIMQFSQDTELFFRKRLKVAIAMVYVSAGVSTLAFVLSTIVAAAKGIENSSSKKFSKNASRLAWALYLFISLGVFIPYLTVAEETDALGEGAGEDAIFYLLGIPAAFSILIMCWHVVACARQRTCRWRITNYHPIYMKVMVTLWAILLATTPVFLASEPKEGEVNFTGAVAMYSELLGAFLHRISLHDDGDGDDKNEDEEDKMPTPSTTDASV